jgi:peptidoglycan/LPS O-acetylase OafA/YrhL
MVYYLERYFAVTLVLALAAPFWVFGLSDSSIPMREALRDAVFVTVVLLGGLWLVKKRRGFQIKGSWRNPSRGELIFYGVSIFSVLVIDFGSKLLFFQKDQPDRIEAFKHFGLHSVFHETSFEQFHFYLLMYLLYLFLLGALFFRFSTKILDRLWLFSAAIALGGAIALFSERLLFGGVHNSFYLSGPLRWLCPP